MEKLKEGTRVRVTHCKHGHKFKIGQYVTVESYNWYDAGRHHYYLTDGIVRWSLCDTEFEVIPDEQPNIDLEYWRYKFAGMAMQALLNNTRVDIKLVNEKPELFAKNCVGVADLLIAELQKGNK